MLAGQPSPRGRHLVAVPQVVHSWPGGHMTLPQQVEPGGAQMELLSHVRQMRSAEQATAPQQDDPDGLHTGSPPQLSSTMSPGQSPSARCAGRNAAHTATAVTARALWT